LGNHPHQSSRDQVIFNQPFRQDGDPEAHADCLAQARDPFRDHNGFDLESLAPPSIAAHIASHAIDFFRVMKKASFCR
jgi:hypothetical protein